MADHVHRPPGTEVLALWGEYIVRQEGRAVHHKREFLYILADICAGSLCCGFAAGQFLIVPGFIVSWNYRHLADGLSITEVSPITSEKDRQAVRQHLQRMFPSQQCVFPSH